jgi:hypothetical protein
MSEINDIIEKLQIIAELLYQERISDAYSELFPLLPRIELLISTTDNDDFTQEVISKLKLALEAMESEDTLLLADVIQYELLECLSNM